MGILSSLFESKNKVDLGELIANGAQIIDVRTPQEYKGGHIKKSVNIPLDKLNGQLKKISKNKPVITCCASGMRSGSAKSILQKAGYNAHNGGPWTNLRKYQ
ncbi:MAG: rhodanese-like domain-containing protein [Bacteroidia bacterium]